MWSVFVDKFIAFTFYGKWKSTLYGTKGKDRYGGEIRAKPPERLGVACGGLICGVPAALTGFGYFLFRQRGTKVFGASATDEDVEAFCGSTAAMGVTSIEISDGNDLITKRTLSAIGKLFWLIKIKITAAKNFDGMW